MEFQGNWEMFRAGFQTKKAKIFVKSSLEVSDFKVTECVFQLPAWKGASKNITQIIL